MADPSEDSKPLIPYDELGSGKIFSELRTKNKRASTYVFASNEYKVIDDYTPPDDLITPNTVAAVYYENEAKTTFCWSTFNLWNDILGGSIVTLPYYLFCIGPWLAGPVFIIFACLNEAQTLNTLYFLAKKYRQEDYPKLCRFALGGGGYVFVCILIFIFNFGGFVGALQVLGSLVPDLLEGLSGIHTVYFERHWTLIFCVTLFVPLSFWKNLSNYSINSFLSCITLIGLTATLLYRVIFEHSKYPMPPDVLKFKADINFLQALGGVSYIFVCHDISFSVFQSFKDATRQRWGYVGKITMAATVLTLLTAGYSGYFMFYDGVKDNILDNFPSNDILATVGRILLALNILISVPYSVFMPRFSLYSIVVFFFGNLKYPKALHAVLTVFVMGLALLLAEFIDDLGSTFELVGAISGVNMAYILPPIIFLKLEGGKVTSPKKIVNIFVLCIGIFAMVASTTSIIYAKIKHED